MVILFQLFSFSAISKCFLLFTFFLIDHFPQQDTRISSHMWSKAAAKRKMKFHASSKNHIFDVAWKYLKYFALFFPLCLLILREVSSFWTRPINFSVPLFPPSFEIFFPISLYFSPFLCTFFLLCMQALTSECYQKQYAGTKTQKHWFCTPTKEENRGGKKVIRKRVPSSTAVALCTRQVAQRGKMQRRKIDFTELPARWWNHTKVVQESENYSPKVNNLCSA